MNSGCGAERPVNQAHARATVLLCAAALLLFAILSYSAALTKSPTSDEPLHALGGYVHRELHDFRINPEDPPLFGYWAALPHRFGELRLDLQSPEWINALRGFDSQQWPFTAGTLFATAGNDGDHHVQRSRAMFVIVGVALGALTAWWAWKLAGSIAAVIATLLFALDPNFLAHASLVKNDVPAALCMLAVAVSLWRFGMCGSWRWLISLTLACAIAINVKFSCVLCGPIIALTLLVRAILPLSWRVLGWELPRAGQRLLAAALVCLVVAGMSYLSIWASYGFRYAPTPDPQSRLDLADMVDFVRKSRTVALLNRVYEIPPQVEKSQSPGAIADAVVWADARRLVPNAWATGFVYTYATTFAKPTFLLGSVAQRGVWYYFPLAILFKTPTATLIAGAMALLSLRWLARAGSAPTRMGAVQMWTVACIGVPMAVYLESALSSGINIGIRHMLPMYPLAFIVISTALAALIRRWGARGYAAVALLLVGLAVESLTAYPNFIAFFNTPSGGSRGGIHLLGDSNLDWGQDLKLLARWQQSHRDKKLYFAYFGTVNPSFYGIDATMMPGGFGANPQLPSPDEDCYIAISATILQGIYLPKEFENLYRSFQQREPITVLGGTIYIYSSSPVRQK